MRYRCKKELWLPDCDGNGFTIENKYTQIKDGTTWVESEDKWRCVGGEVRLENEQEESWWLEIPREMLEEHFDLIK